MKASSLNWSGIKQQLRKNGHIDDRSQHICGVAPKGRAWIILCLHFHSMQRQETSPREATETSGVLCANFQIGNTGISEQAKIQNTLQLSTYFCFLPKWKEMMAINKALSSSFALFQLFYELNKTAALACHNVQRKIIINIRRSTKASSAS